MVTTSKFLLAATRGDLDKIKQGLDEHIDINVKDSSGRNALHKAASKGQEAVAQFLIANEVSLNTQDEDGNTPMHLAAEGGYTSLIYLLMNSGADPFIRNEAREIPLQTGIEYRQFNVKELFVKYKSLRKNQTLLHLAAIKKDYEILSYIITLTSGDEAININAVDSQGYSALHWAIKLDFEAGAIGLLDAGIDVNAKDNKGNTPLHVAMGLLNPKPLVTLLADKGTDFTVKNDDGQIPLHLASSRGHLDVLNILLSESLGINFQDKRGRTPLYLATEKDFQDIVYFLIDKKADVNLSDIEGNTPLHIAALKDYSNLVIELIKSNPDVDIKNNKAQTPLHLAAFGGSADVVPLLVEGNAGINAKDDSKKTPFELAVEECDVVVDQIKKDNLEKVIKYLVESKKGLNGGTLLHSAVYEDNIKLVQLLLKSKADVNAQDRTLKSPLHYAASKNYVNIGEDLLKSNAIVDAQDFYGDTSLYIACGFNNTVMVDKLIKYNASVDLGNTIGRTPLHQSSSKGYFEVTVMLLNANANVNVQDKDYNTPLSEAQKGNHTMVAELLIQHGAKVDILSDGKAAIHRAVEDGDETAIHKIVEQNGDINIKDNAGQTALHYAAYLGKKVILKLLLDLGSVPDPEDEIGRTPFDLTFASQSDTKSVVDFLVKYRDKENNTLLHLAVKKGRLLTMKGLFEKGADIYAKNNEQQIPLHLAMFNNNLDVLNELINLGIAGLCARDSQGRYPLHLAVLGGHLNIIKRLLELLVDVNVVDLLLQTPLHLASINGNTAMVKVLADAGANVNAKDLDEITPLWLAVEVKSMDTIAELKKKGADINIRNKDGQQVLHLASEMGDLNLVRELESLGADVYGKDYESNIPLQVATKQLVIDFFAKWKDKKREDTILHHASREDNINLVKSLIDNGVDLNVRNNFGWTPLNVAIQFGSNKVSKLLKEQGANETVYSEEKYGIHAAVQNCNVQLVDKAIDSDPNIIHSLDNVNNTLLHYAAQFACIDILKMLIEKNADVNARNYYGLTALHMACGREYLDNDEVHASESFLFVVKVLGQSSDVNSMDSDGNTPLHFTSRKGNLEIVKELIMFNANPALKNNNQRSPFELAVYYDQKKIIKYFKEEYRDNHNNYLLHLAARTCNDELVGSLLLQNAKVDVKNDKGNLPLHEAILFSSPPLIRSNSTATYLSVGPNNNATRDSNSTAVVVDHSSSNSTATYLSVGPNNNATRDSNSTAVVVDHSSSNSTATDLSIGPRSNSTAIDLSVGPSSNSTTTVVNDSLDSTEPFQANVNGSHILCGVVEYIPKSRSCTTTVEKFTQQGSDVNDLNSDGYSALHLATKLDELDIVKNLVYHGAEVNLRQRNVIGNTALHEAAYNGNVNILDYLIDKGAITNIENQQKRAPLHLSSLNDQLDAAKFLLKKKQIFSRRTVTIKFHWN